MLNVIDADISDQDNLFPERASVKKEAMNLAARILKPKRSKVPTILMSHLSGGTLG